MDLTPGCWVRTTCDVGWSGYEWDGVSTSEDWSEGQSGKLMFRKGTIFPYRHADEPEFGIIDSATSVDGEYGEGWTVAHECLEALPGFPANATIEEVEAWLSA